MEIVKVGDSREWMFRIPCPIVSARGMDGEHTISQLVPIAEELVRVVTEQEFAGLAAPQIGKHARVIAFRTGAGYVRALIDPKVIEHQGRSEPYICSSPSFPERMFDTRRSPKVVVQGYNLEGEPHRLTLEGFQAGLVQMLIGFLDGRPPAGS